MRITKEVGGIKAEAWTDGWPISIHITENSPANNGVQLHIWGVEQLTDLQYALDRLQAQLQPIVARMNKAAAS